MSYPKVAGENFDAKFVDRAAVFAHTEQGRGATKRLTQGNGGAKCLLIDLKAFFCSLSDKVTGRGLNFCEVMVCVRVACVCLCHF